MEAENWLIENDKLLSDDELNEYIQRLNKYLDACKIINNINVMKRYHNNSNIDYTNDEIKAFDNMISAKKSLDDYYFQMQEIYTKLKR